MLGLGLNLTAITAALPSIVRSGLQMFLPFEKDGTDTSSNTNNATLKTGKALSFDGTNDYVDCGNVAVSLKTLSFWINLDSTTEKVLQLTSSQSVEVSSGSITLNGTWTGSNVYVNGTDTNTIAASSWKRVVITTTSAITVDDFEMGRISSAYGDFLLSDIEIWDTTWTAADVTFDYNNPQHLVSDRSGSTLAVSNLKGYWHLSEGAGTSTVYDSSGGGKNGTINGASWSLTQATIPQLALMDYSKKTIGSDVVTLVSDPQDPSEDIRNQDVRLREHSINIDGIGYADIANHSSINPGQGDFSIDGWFKLSTQSGRRFIEKHTATDNRYLVQFSGNNLQIFYQGTTNSVSASSNNLSSKEGNWIYFAATVDRNNEIKIYIDNDAVVTTSITEDPINDINPTATLRIGKTIFGSTSFDGLIDDVRFYNRVLTATEVSNNYNAGLSQHKAGSSFSDDFSSDYGL